MRHENWEVKYMKEVKRIGMILILILISLVGCSQTDQQEMMSAVSDALDSPEVAAIKVMTMDDGVLLGDLFEAGLSSLTYELNDPAEDGNTYR